MGFLVPFQASHSRIKLRDSEIRCRGIGSKIGFDQIVVEKPTIHVDLEF